MDEHDDSQCDHLHINADFRIILLGLSKGALDLEKWFNEVFKLQNPNSANDFDIQRYFDAQEEMIEITQHNPMFSFDALQCLFEAHRQKPTVTPELKVVTERRGH